MNPALQAWGYYARWTARSPGLAALVPFVPVIALWWLVVSLTEEDMSEVLDGCVLPRVQRRTFGFEVALLRRR